MNHIGYFREYTKEIHEPQYTIENTKEIYIPE